MQYTYDLRGAAEVVNYFNAACPTHKMSIDEKHKYFIAFKIKNKETNKETHAFISTKFAGNTENLNGKEGWFACFDTKYIDKFIEELKHD